MKLMQATVIAALALGAAAAHAGGNVHWSVGVVAAPGGALGVSNTPPIYVALAPVYYAPPPPPVVYYRPAPVFYQPYVVTKVKVKHKHKHWRHH